MIGSGDSVGKTLGEGLQHEDGSLPLEKSENQASVLSPGTLHKASSCAASHDRSQNSNNSSLQPSQPTGDTHRSEAPPINDEESQEPTGQTELRTRFEVTWDGEADPENPRMMSQARKWLIVMIAATSSTCVYEAPIFLSISSLSFKNAGRHDEFLLRAGLVLRPCIPRPIPSSQSTSTVHGLSLRLA